MLSQAPETVISGPSQLLERNHLGVKQPVIMSMDWWNTLAMLMHPEDSLKGDSCGGEQRVQLFLLLWPFWNIAGMVWVYEKKWKLSVEESLLKYLQSCICFLVECLKYEDCFFAPKSSKSCLGQCLIRGTKKKRWRKKRKLLRNKHYFFKSTCNSPLDQFNQGCGSP